MVSKMSQDSGSVHFSQDHMTISRPGSGATIADISFDRCYERNSLPRQKCEHHKHEFHTYSLPRKEPHHPPHLPHPHQHQHYHPTQYNDSCNRTDSTETFNGPLVPRQNPNTSMSHESSMESIRQQPQRDSNDSLDRRSYENIVAYKRPSYPNIQPAHQQHQTLQRRRSSYQPNGRSTPSEDVCSTCESEMSQTTTACDTVVKQEKEIFIDFKPRISPITSPRSRKKRLQKTLSEGEILFDQRRYSELCADAAVPIASASEEDLKTPIDDDDDNEATASAAKLMYSYRNAPIKDEGICDNNHLFKLPRDDEAVRTRREAFRKRSISLEDPSVFFEDDDCLPSPVTTIGTMTTTTTVQVHTPAKSASPPSPSCMADELSVRGHSDFPSTDSLANDLTRDHSDSIWNESQATVLQADPR